MHKKQKIYICILGNEGLHEYVGKCTVKRSKVVHPMKQLNSLREGDWKHTDDMHYSID